MPRTPKPALRKPKPRSPRPTSRLPISAHGICPFRAPSFFLRNFFLRPAPMPGGCCRERDDGNSAPAAKAPEPRVGSPGQKSGSEVRGRAAGQSPGRGFWSGSGPVDRVRVGLRAGAAKAGCRSRVPRAASDRRKQGPEGVFCTAGSDVPPAKAPEPRVGIRKVCRKTGCGSCGSGGMRRKAFSGLGPGRLPKAFRLRRIFPRTEAFSAVHERRRGNPRSVFPSGGGPGSAGSRVPGAGSGCGRFLRRPHPAAENRGNPASPVKKETFQTGFVEEL